MGKLQLFFTPLTYNMAKARPRQHFSRLARAQSPWELLKCANSFSFREGKHVLVPMDGLASQALKGEIQMSQLHTECLHSGPAGLRMLDGRTLAF